MNIEQYKPFSQYKDYDDFKSKTGLSTIDAFDVLTKALNERYLGAKNDG